MSKIEVEIIEILDEEDMIQSLTDIWGDMSDYTNSGTEIQEEESYIMQPRIASKNPRNAVTTTKKTKARKTKTITKKNKEEIERKRLEFLQRRGSRLYNKGRGIQ